MRKNMACATTMRKQATCPEEQGVGHGQCHHAAPWRNNAGSHHQCHLWAWTNRHQHVQKRGSSSGLEGEPGRWKKQKLSFALSSSMISFWSEESWCEDALGSTASGYDAGIVTERGPRAGTRRTSRDRRGEGRSSQAEERVAARPTELSRNFALTHRGDSVFTGVGERTRDSNEPFHEVMTIL